MAAASLTGVLIGGRYRLQEFLAEGGMGWVYSALDESQGERVALKILQTDASSNKDPRRRAMLEREFHALKQLQHPRIIRVYDYGLDPAGAYYTMELLEGERLKRDTALGWRETCAVLRDVASCLAMLHARRWIHRDIKPDNLRRAADGRVKLLDFGAMTPMGVPSDVVGTAPYMAPEFLERRAVDGRADLFSVGALAYSLLTGVHAFPARFTSQLPALWRHAPAPPRSLDENVPEALSDLVMRLLAIDPSYRPTHAALVLERVSAIAGLPIDDHEDVRRAYLVTPRLVGRDAPLAKARAALSALADGRKIALLIEGDRGVGRSRFLDACLVEAQLLGATVLRVETSGSARSFDVACGLLQQLVQLYPEVARGAARPHQRLLSSLVPELGGEPSKKRDRAALVSALTDFWIAVGRRVPIALAVDDVDRIDGASQAMLASLAHHTIERSIALLATATTNGRREGPIRILEQSALRVRLSPLTEAETTELAASVFDRADHLTVHARWLHSVSKGKPAVQMQLLEHMVLRGTAHYDAGTWSLSRHVDVSGLPTSLATALRERVSALGEEAQSLARVMALLAEGRGLSAGACALLTESADPATVGSALDELGAAGVLERYADSWAFSDAAWAPALLQGQSAEFQRAAHARLARATRHDGRLQESARHHLCSGDVSAAVADLLEDLKTHRRTNFGADTLALVDDVLRAAENLPIDGRDRRFLRLTLVSIAQLLADQVRFRRDARALLEDLKRDAGLTDYLELEHVSDPSERLQLAFMRASQRFEQTPAEQRGLSVAEALPALVQMCANFAGVGLVQLDLGLCEQVPSLAPFFPISPAAAVIDLLVAGTAEFIRGHFVSGRDLYRQVLAKLEAPDRAGLPRAAHDAIRLAVLSGLAVPAAAFGQPEALEYADVVAAGVGHRANAERMRMSYYLVRGLNSAAERSRRRADLLELQEGSSGRYPGTTSRLEATVYAWSDDLLGIKRLADRISTRARTHRMLALVHGLCLVHYDRIQGDYQSALTRLDDLMKETPVGRNSVWMWFAAARLQTLVASGDAVEAAALGAEYLAACEAHALVLAVGVIGPWYARALAETDRFDEALELLSRSEDLACRMKVQGSVLAQIFEQGVRVAVRAQDAAAARRYFVAFEEALGPDPTSAQRAHLLGLGRLAAEVGAKAPTPTAADGPQAQAVANGMSRDIQAALDKLSTERTSGGRAKRVLELLLESAEATTGYLCALRGGQVDLIAGLPEGPAPSGLVAWLSGELIDAGESDMDALPTVTVLGPGEGSVFKDAASNVYRAIPLVSESQGMSVVCGIVGVCLPAPRWPPAQLLSVCAAALLADLGVDPLTRMR